MKKILVLDANQRSALAVIRSLGKHTTHVVAADYTRPALGAASKYARDFCQYTNPSENPKQFLRDISDIVQQHAVEAIIPATDLTTMLLADRPECIAPARLACAAQKSYEQLTDKRQLTALAQRIGVPTPRTRVAHTPEEIYAAAAELGFPLVLKPGRSRYLKDGRVISTSVRIVETSHNLPAIVRDLAWLGDIPCLAQAFVPGHGAGVFALCGPQGFVAWFAHRRLREKPPSGGVSVLSESVAVDAAMQLYAQQLLSAAGWFGVAMVEFRIAPDGTPYLMEINGRFWGSLQLAVDSGVDFPWLLYQLLNGDNPAPVTSYVTGRRLRWLLGDVDNLLLQLRAPQLDFASKLKVAGNFMGSFFDPSCRQEIFRWSDPRPALSELRQWTGALFK